MIYNEIEIEIKLTKVAKYFNKIASFFSFTFPTSISALHTTLQGKKHLHTDLAYS